jgi:HAD superfamily hydrolase (TIGR01490 family)
MISSPNQLQKKTKLNVFDLDGTLLKNNCSFSFSWYLYKKGIFSLSDQIYCVLYAFAYKLGNLSIERLHKAIFNKLFIKKSFRILEKEAAHFVKKHIHKMINPHILNEINAAKVRGERVLLLSSSPDFLVKPISELLDIDYMGTKYQIDDNGRFKKISLLMSGKQKALIVTNLKHEESFESDNITIYSDHEDDLPLLKIAGKAIAVNPSLKLRRIAKEKKWQVLG